MVSFHCFIEYHNIIIPIYSAHITRSDEKPEKMNEKYTNKPLMKNALYDMSEN